MTMNYLIGGIDVHYNGIGEQTKEITDVPLLQDFSKHACNIATPV
jgi:hypothetical protein